MKTIQIIAVAMLMLAFLPMTVQAKNEVNSETTYGMYKVGISQPAHTVAKNAPSTYTIYYEELDVPVTVTVFEDEKCKNYIVRTGNFEVQYTCNGKYFGVKYVDAAYATIPLQEMKAKIDRTNFLYQRVITRKLRSEKDFVRLIACYLPEIMNA